MPDVEFDLNDLSDLALIHQIDLMALERGEVWARRDVQYEGLERPVLIPDAWRKAFSYRGRLADGVSPDEAHWAVIKAYTRSDV